jgi:GntR family transcriptional regulator/MocR family aminotransferase
LLCDAIASISVGSRPFGIAAGSTVALGQQCGAYIVEDDYDGEYRYDIRPIRPLHAFDEAAHVIYLGTISKTLSPLLRLGYLVLPPELVDAFRAAKRLADRHSPTLEQAALAEFIQSGAYERHIRKLRRKNAQRRAALLDAFSENFGSTITVQGSEAGLHVVAWFRKYGSTQEEQLVQKARSAGVGIYPISDLYEHPRAVAAKRRAGFVFGYAALEERDIRHGVARLAGALRTA